MTERLTTLAAVKQWLKLPADVTDGDELLVRLINAASLFVINWLNRNSFQSTQWTENFKGNGKTTVLLKNFPVLSIVQLGVAGKAIPPATIGIMGMPSNGYVLSDARSSQQFLELYGYDFCQGYPCQVIYSSGYETVDVSTLPAPVAPATAVVYTPISGGQWSKDQGVVLAGVALTLSPTNTPASGTYYVDEWGTYTFNGDAAGKVAATSYSYTPFDVSWACTEVIGEYYRKQDRIGMMTKSLGGQETVSFSQKDMSVSIQMVLQPFMNVIPI